MRRLPPKSWKPPDPYEQRCSKHSREAKALAVAACSRIARHKRFPPDGARGTKRELRLLAYGLGCRVEEMDLPRGEVARAREETAGEGDWVITLARDAAWEQQREGLMHELTEIVAGQIVPDFAHVLFEGDERRMLKYVGADERGSLPHLAAVVSEGIWCKCFDWYEPIEVSWARHFKALGLAAPGWHKEYWASGRHKGEIERCRVEGVDF